MSREQILAAVDALPAPPIAIEALWDGDPEGWFIRFHAITADAHTHPLGVVSHGGDIRLFQGQVPPWPEASVAQHLGDELAARFGVVFYFPSPLHPEDACPSWQERHHGYPCRRGGILLVQRDPCPWRGVCYHCHLAEEWEQREATWMPEDRAGSRCYLCGQPAHTHLNGRPACASCCNKYEVYTCQCCQTQVLVSKSCTHTTLCSRCEVQNTLAALLDSQRNRIHDALAASRISGIHAVMEVMACTLPEAHDIVSLLHAKRPTVDPVDVNDNRGE